jgi:hypothetical protein
MRGNGIKLDFCGEVHPRTANQETSRHRNGTHLANDFYATAGPSNINPSPKPRTNKNAWSLVDHPKSTYWGHRTINISGDYQDVLELNKKMHTAMMTILCDRGAVLGTMVTNITDNFAREVKPQQLQHFFNLNTCNLDNNNLFYQYYY